ncbi:MAG: hypothetical protein RIQ53_2431 [Pseudomonadota bacterium]
MNADSPVAATTAAAPDAPDAALLAARPAIGEGFRLQYEQAQQAWVLLYPEGMVRLNGSAGEILSRCDGQRTLSALITELETEFSTTGLTADVLGFVAIARQQRWLVLDRPH